VKKLDLMMAPLRRALVRSTQSDILTVRRQEIAIGTIGCGGDRARADE
jgi:hypothetical protein